MVEEGEESGAPIMEEDEEFKEEVKEMNDGILPLIEEVLD